MRTLFRSVHFDVTSGHLRGDAQSAPGLNDTTTVEAAAEGLTLSGHVSRCFDSEHTCIHVKMAWAAVLSWPEVWKMSLFLTVLVRVLLGNRTNRRCISIYLFTGLLCKETCVLFFFLNLFLMEG